MSTRNAMEEELLSDEDMFSPKKNKEKTVGKPVEADQRPGCKEHLVNKFKKLLTNAGIPPPPLPDFHVDQFLTLWSDHQSFLWAPNDLRDKSKANDQPDNLGKCLNVDRSCEEFELIGQQVCERYIWSETTVVTSTVNVKLTQSAKKRRKANGWGLSPRTRISYLTRRMTTFQRDNIASAANKATQILISRSEPRKNTKKPEIKGKRALFLSPERSNKFQTPEQGKSRRLCRQLMNSSPPEKIPTTRSSEKRKCSRSLFCTKEANQQTNPPQQHQSLSTQHRQKMLWAVSNALKCVKIRMNDPEFKNFAALLFKATYEKWKTDSQSTCSGDKKVSTSDAMLATAKSLVEGVTGRRMSPKSAKKQAAPKCKTPLKSKRDENNPPSSAPSSAPLTPLGSIVRISGEADIFPLDPDESLANKLDPEGRLTVDTASPRKVSRRLAVEESPVKSCRKRKRPEEFDRAEACSSYESSRVLRNRTPAKATPVKNSSNVKRPKLDPSTPLKSLTPSRPVRQSPRLRNRTPSKPQPDFCSPIQTNRTPLKLLAQNTPEKGSLTPLRRRSVARALSLIEESPAKAVLSADLAVDGEMSSRKAERASPRILRSRTPSKVTVLGAEAAPGGETICNLNPNLGTGRSQNVSDGVPPGILRNKSSHIVGAPGAEARLQDVSPRVIRNRTPSKVAFETGGPSEDTDCLQNPSIGVVRSLDMTDGIPRILKKRASLKETAPRVEAGSVESPCNRNSCAGLVESNLTNDTSLAKLGYRTPSKVAALGAEAGGSEKINYDQNPSLHVITSVVKTDVVSPRILRSKASLTASAPGAEAGPDDEFTCNQSTSILESRFSSMTNEVSPQKLRNRTPSRGSVLGAKAGASEETDGYRDPCLGVISSSNVTDGIPPEILRNPLSPTVAALGGEVGPDDESTCNRRRVVLVESQTNYPSPPMLRSRTPSKVTGGAEDKADEDKSKKPLLSMKSTPGVNRKKSPKSSRNDKPPRLVAETERRRLERRCSIDPPTLTREESPPILDRILSDWASPIEDLTKKRRRSSATPRKSGSSEGGGSGSKRRPLSLAASRRSSD